MLIRVDPTGSVTGFKETLAQVLAHKETKGILILACDANNFTPEQLNETLRQVTVPLFGAIFPEIIHNREKLARGTIIVGLPVSPNVQIIPGLSDAAVEYEAIIDEKIPHMGQAKTMFVWVDGLSKRIGDLIDSLFHIFGLELNYIGGGAGSLSFNQKPCLFTEEGLLQDSAVLALLTLESGVGVSHGWQSISGPFKVTEADRNIIKTLDWKPAFEVYRDVIETKSGQSFKEDNFFEIAKGYPFGINKLGAEKIVRNPIMLTERGEIICIGELPEDSYVDILTGDPSSLVKAAGNALTLGQKAFQASSSRKTIFFIDCISRVLFLEQAFSRELDAVFDKQTGLIGALTLGEIANSGKDYLEFYNKTAVVGVLAG